jgi:hypothetical protein
MGALASNYRKDDVHEACVRYAGFLSRNVDAHCAT